MKWRLDKRKMTKKMILKFIGADGSMGLIKGNVYTVEVSISDKFIYVDWGNRRCPYSSPETMWANWEKVEGFD